MGAFIETHFMVFGSVFKFSERKINRFYEDLQTTNILKLYEHCEQTRLLEIPCVMVGGTNMIIIDKD